MSRETQQWLDTMTLHGFGKVPWHGKDGNDNIYPDAIPVSAIRERLFNFTAEEAPLAVVLADGTVITDPTRKVIFHSNTHRVFNVTSDTYTRHQFGEWLVDDVLTMCDTLPGGVNIGTAGLLRKGAVAWVQVEMPEVLQLDKFGFGIRPHLLCTSSHDGSLASTFKRCVTNTVCDNTHAMALNEKGSTHRVKHTRWSESGKLNVSDARNTLGLLDETVDAFTREVEELLAVEVAPKPFAQFLDVFTGLDKMAADATGRGRTLAERKRDTLASLYLNDNRVAPWSGTAWGVVQAVNTYEQHVAPISKGADRAERNIFEAASGTLWTEDKRALSVLTKVLATV